MYFNCEIVNKLFIGPEQAKGGVNLTTSTLVTLIILRVVYYSLKIVILLHGCI